VNDFSSLEHDFQSYLLSGQMDIAQSVIETETVSAQTRLNIYRNAYQTRLVKALASNFSCLKAYLGEETFEQMSLSYIESHPSNYRSIRWYGDELSSFLNNYYDSEFYCLAELAHFEWNMTLAFDAADAPVVQLAQMAAIPSESWGSMQLTGHPSLKRMNFLWNVVSIWEAITNNQTPIDSLKNPNEISWMLWRKDYMNRFYSLDQDEAWAIDSMLNKLTFGELCEGLCQWHNEDTVGMKAATLLKNWIQAGLISEIKY
jgi:hypothetical protein